MNTLSINMKPVVIAVLAGGLLLQGCTSVHSISARSPALAQGDRVIVTLNNGDTRKLEYASIDENEVEGFDRKGNLHTYSLTEVKSLSVKRFNRTKTGLIIGAIAAGLAASAINEGIQNSLGPGLGYP